MKYPTISSIIAVSVKLVSIKGLSMLLVYLAAVCLRHCCLPRREAGGGRETPVHVQQFCTCSFIKCQHACNISSFTFSSTVPDVVLCGLVVSVLAIGPKVLSLSSGRGRWGSKAVGLMS
jgi:hypothetical protein